MRIKFVGLVGMRFEELRDIVLGLLGSSVDVVWGVVQKYFWFSMVRPLAWDAVSAGKGKLALKSACTG